MSTSIGFHEFIRTHYSVVQCGEEVDTSDYTTAEIIFLEDPNTSERAVNSLFINTYARENDQIFLEEAPANEKIDTSKVVQASMLDTKARISGWDIGYANTIAGKQFLKIAKLEVKYATIQTRYLSGIDSEKKKCQLEERLARIRAGSIYYQSKINQKKTTEKVAETFQDRLQTMIQTIENINAGANRRVFVFVDSIMARSSIEKYGSRFNADALKAFVKTHNALVLSPKFAEMIVLNRKRKELDEHISTKLFQISLEENLDSFANKNMMH